MKKVNVKKLVMYSLLTAIIVLMGFTPLGYLKVGVVEITFLTIPVIIGGVLLGKKAGGFLGLVFGLTSFIQCFGMSAFGSALLAINGFSAFVVCVVPRVIMGFVCGLVAELVKNKSRFLLASLTAPILNTVLFVGALLLFFGNSDYIQNLMSTLGGGYVIAFIVAFVGVNGLIEAGVCAVVGTVVSAGVYKALNSRGRSVDK